MAKKKTINVKGASITIIDQSGGDYISLTDMVKNMDGDDHIRNWMRNRNTLEFLGVWENLNNKDFKGVEFDTFRKEAGLNKFNMTPKKWVESTDAIGIVSKAGRYGGTYAHKDIAYNFAMWLSPEFQLLIIKEFDRLKEEESQRQQVGWDFQRYLSKVNYRIQTDSIKENIIPISRFSKDKTWIEYAEEADILNMAVFGTTAKKWKEEHPKEALEGKNIRDLANLYQLNVISNLEVINSKLIREGIDRNDRYEQLVEEAKFQLNSLYNSKSYTFAQIQSPFTETTEDITYEVADDEVPERPLSEFNMKLKQGLEFNPKEDAPKERRPSAFSPKALEKRKKKKDGDKGHG